VTSNGVLVEASGLKKHYPLRTGFLASFLRSGGRRWVRAVDGIDLQIHRGEAVGLVGESGSGKSTTGLVMALLEKPTAGEVRIAGRNPFALQARDLREMRKKVQIIFQDPYLTLDPRFRVIDTVREPLGIHRIGTRDRRQQMAARALEEAGLPKNLVDRYPHELSGGQRQRVAIARAMVLEPEFVVADEPVSMLDVSVRAGIMSLMVRLKEQHQVTYLFISHDLAVCRYMCERIAVMYLGRIVETGDRESLLQEPFHPYTRLLVSAVPVPDPKASRKRVQVSGEIPSSSEIIQGCGFYSRCQEASPECAESVPPLREVAPGRLVACHKV